jgi:uracil-DNA glycosylase
MAEIEDKAKARVARSLHVRRNARAVLNQLIADPNLGRFVDSTLDIPDIFCGEGEIRLIFLGQDPTVKNPRSRRRIKKVLNLDKDGSLKAYLSKICEGLGLELDQHVYATNYLKNFFVDPPTQIDEIDVFQVFGAIWLPALQAELALFPQAPVITLGEPLLTALVRGAANPRVRDYWGYTPRWKSGETGPFRYLGPHENSLERTVFPFPHQPKFDDKTRGVFYRERLADYTAFVRQEAFSGSD